MGSMMRSVGDRLKQMDFYPKTLEDFRIKTISGGAGYCVNVYSYCGQLLLTQTHALYHATCSVPFSVNAPLNMYECLCSCKLVDYHNLLNSGLIL